MHKAIIDEDLSILRYLIDDDKYSYLYNLEINFSLTTLMNKVIHLYH